MAFGNFYLDFEALKRLPTTYSWTLKLFHTNKTPKIAYHISVCSDFSSKLFLRGKTSQIQQLCTQNQMKQTNLCLLLLVFLPCVFPAFGIETIASKIRKIWSLPFASKEKKQKKNKKRSFEIWSRFFVSGRAGSGGDYWREERIRQKSTKKTK